MFIHMFETLQIGRNIYLSIISYRKQQNINGPLTMSPLMSNMPRGIKHNNWH